MKLIKFDLAINGEKVRNIEELRNNFTLEILDLYSSGALLKWLKSRSLTTESDRLNAISADHSDVDKLVALCEIFEVDAAQEVSINRDSAGNEIYKEKQVTITNQTVQILRHPNCPTTILAQHLGNADEEIRAAIARNPALNEVQQKQLADDKSVLVLLALLDNPKLSSSNKTRLDANLSIALEAGLSAKKAEAEADVFTTSEAEATEIGIWNLPGFFRTKETVIETDTSIVEENNHDVVMPGIFRAKW